MGKQGLPSGQGYNFGSGKKAQELARKLKRMETDEAMRRRIMGLPPKKAGPKEPEA